MSEQISLKDIVMLPEIQIRVKISPKTVDEYAASMKDGAAFDDVDLFRDSDDRLILADGAHRVLAAQQRGLKTISATIHKCAPEEALSKALEICLERNCRHGLRLTPADKRNAVSRALADKIIRRRGDRSIAKLCGVSPGLVSDVRKGDANDAREKRKPKKASKLNYTPPEPEVVENSTESRSDTARTLKDWVSSGSIDWPEVAGVFSNDQRMAILVPRINPMVRLKMEGKGTKRWVAKRIEQMRDDSGSFLEIELGEIVRDVKE